MKKLYSSVKSNCLQTTEKSIKSAQLKIFLQNWVKRISSPLTPSSWKFYFSLCYRLEIILHDELSTASFFEVWRSCMLFLNFKTFFTIQFVEKEFEKSFISCMRCIMKYRTFSEFLLNLCMTIIKKKIQIKLEKETEFYRTQ